MSWHAKFYTDNLMFPIKPATGWYCSYCNYTHPWKIEIRNDCPEMKKKNENSKATGKETNLDKKGNLC